MLLVARCWFDISLINQISSLKICGYALGSLPWLTGVAAIGLAVCLSASCRCWSLRVLTWLCFYAYLVTQQPSAFLRFKVFTQPLRSLVGDSTSSFRLSFGFKVFVRIRFGLGFAISLSFEVATFASLCGYTVLFAVPFLLPIFWGFFPLGAFAIERAVQVSAPDAPHI